MNNLELIKVDIDWLKIINLTLNRKDWGKTYVIEKYGNVSITITMDSFDFSRSVARFIIKCVYPEDKYYSSYDSFGHVSYYLKNYSNEFFRIVLLKAVRSLINDVILRRTKSKAEELYSKYKKHKSDINSCVLIEYNLINDFKKINSTTDKDIKRICLYKFEEKLLERMNIIYKKKVDNYVNRKKICSDDLIYIQNEISKLIEKAVNSK